MFRTGFEGVVFPLPPKYNLSPEPVSLIIHINIFFFLPRDKCACSYFVASRSSRKQRSYFKGYLLKRVQIQVLRLGLWIGKDVGKRTEGVTMPTFVFREFCEAGGCISLILAYISRLINSVFRACSLISS